MASSMKSAGSVSQFLINRRTVSRMLAGAGALFLLHRAGTWHKASIGAQEEDDGSGHGRGRGRGRGGDHGNDDENDDENGDEQGDDIAVTGAVPANALEVRIISDDAGGFSPAELTVDSGQVVAFVNGHSDEHTATGSGFDTGIIESGAIATVTLDVPGVFFYACQIHPEMTGIISVRDESGAIPEAASVATPTGGTNIAIENLAFDPARADVQVGSTVVWTNADSVPHTVTATNGAFDSGIFDPGSSFSWTFDVAGTFDYSCQLHPQMLGSIVVSSEPGSDAQAAAEELPVKETGEEGIASTVNADLQGPWMVELEPDAALAVSGSRALFTFHEDGTLSADFAGSGESAVQAERFGPAQGAWELEGEQVQISLAVLVLDAVDEFSGLAIIAGDLDLNSETGRLEGEVTITGTPATGDAISGRGMFRGLRVPLGS